MALARRHMYDLGRGERATPADVLRLAQRLIHRGGWSPQSPALNPQGKSIAQLDERAWSFSCAGAIGRARYELCATWMTGVRAGVVFCAAVGASPNGFKHLRAWERASERTGQNIDDAFAAAIWLADNPTSQPLTGVLLDATA